ncbi:MAG: hypothetical protein GY773_22935, partial [Actinomycetia bacterium]|nr:hypothetical protein [Actinomycetes bacterium]
IEVSYTPFGVDEEASVIVNSNDPDTGKALVDLSGGGLVPELDISPDPYDFGNTYVGCAQEATLTMSNVGTDVLTVSEISDGGDGEIGLDLNFAFNLPLELGPGDSVELYMDFDPFEDVSYEHNLVVTSDEPMGTREATQTGSGKYTADYTDEFEVPYNPPTDIMFLVDQSCSMD